MTDREKWKKLLDESDLGYVEEEKQLTLTAGDKNIRGYCDFVCVVRFDENDKFLELGIWE